METQLVDCPIPHLYIPLPSRTAAAAAAADAAAALAASPPCAIGAVCLLICEDDDEEEDDDDEEDLRRGHEISCSLQFDIEEVFSSKMKMDVANFHRNFGSRFDEHVINLKFILCDPSMPLA